MLALALQSDIDVYWLWNGFPKLKLEIKTFKCLERLTQSKASTFNRQLYRHLLSFGFTSSIMRQLWKYYFSVPDATVSKEQKCFLCDALQARKLQNQSITCHALATCFKQNFKLSTLTGNSTIAGNFWESSEQPAIGPARIYERFHNCEGGNSSLKDALFSWICDQATLRRMINYPIVQWKTLVLWRSAMSFFQIMNRLRCRSVTDGLQNLNAGGGLSPSRLMGSVEILTD